MNVVNAIVNGNSVIYGDPFGPENAEGQDIFKKYVDAAYRRAGYIKRIAVDQRPYHPDHGGVHCATNVIRAVPAFKWWTQ